MAPKHLDIDYTVACAEDRDDVVQLLAELIDELSSADSAHGIKARLPADISAALSSDQVCIFLARESETLVGLSRADVLTDDPIFRLRDDKRCGYVDQMFVRPAWRGKRIGTELLRRCEAWFRELGIKHCLLHAAPKAVRFYARDGYQPNREMFKRL